MNLCLRVVSGADTPFVYQCLSDVVIGRAETADLCLPRDRFLSKRHARVFEDTGAWYVEDLGSRNTTLLNGHPVDARAQVFEGDVIRLSDCRIEGYELYASNRPSRTVSGDLYRIEARENGTECVLLVADVSGKGIGASLLTASLEALAMGPIEMGRSPDEICNKVSRRLHARTPAERYATALLAVLQPETGFVRYARTRATTPRSCCADKEV